MTREHISNAVGTVSASYIEEADRFLRRAKVKKSVWSSLGAAAACLVLCAAAGISAVAYAGGAFDGLRAYFSGKLDPYMDEFLSAVDSVSNADVELRLEGADMTFVFSLQPQACPIDEPQPGVCLGYEGLALSLDTRAHLSPEYTLTAELPGGAALTNFSVSRIGFYFTAPVTEGFAGSFDIKLIRRNGTLEEDIDFAGSFGWFSDAPGTPENEASSKADCAGLWGGGVPVGIMEPDEYAGMQVNGVNYFLRNKQ